MPVNNCPQPKKTGSQTQKTAIYVHPVSGMSQSSQNVALSSFPKHLSQHSTKKNREPDTENRHLRPSCLRHVTVFSKRCTLLIPEALAST
ncbi:hypothetical protein, partial [Faecalibaculum rodentium]|uniref:hypothetical protein n=1 Tax=Faecalibaculum rodentium TaxID=1702221 RepID=UPI0025A52DFD